MLSKFKIKTKMVLSLGLLILFMYGITIFLVMRNTNSIISEEASEKTDYLASHYSSVIKENISNAMNISMSIAYTYEGFIATKAKPTQKTLNAILHQIMKSQPQFSGIWVMIDPGILFDHLYSPYFYRENGKIVSEMVEDIKHYNEQKNEDYYTLPKQQKKEVLLEPYMDPDIKVMMTTVAVPIIVDGKFYGVAGVDFTLDTLTTTVSAIKPYEIGIASLISNSGKYIAHPDTSKMDQKIGGNIPLLQNAAQAIKDGKQYSMTDFSNTLKEETYRIFIPIQVGDTDKAWSFSVEVPMSKVLENGKKILWVCLVTGIVSVLVAGFVIFLIAFSITKPINQIVAGLKDIAQGEGDLTMRLPVSSKDELGELGSWFNVFMEKMQSIIVQVSGNTDQVDQASHHLSVIATELSSHAESTSGRANNVATATEELTATISTVAAAMEESTTNTSMVASASEEMTATISQIADNVHEAAEISGSAVQQAQKTSQRMADLEKAAQAISNVTESITDISDKTNLLALNATIEAARAGDAGKGFAVVANEIKELAAQTVDATTDIRNQISGIQVTSTTSISSIDEIVKIINQINDIIQTITRAVGEQSTATQEITGNITQASQGLMEINENMNQGASISGEISGDIAQVSEAATNIAEQSSGVTEQAAHLQELSSALKQIVNSFKIS